MNTTPEPLRLDAIAAFGTVLSVWAHPDDETYLAGGFMASARARGQRVVRVSATAGERGCADPAAWPPARLGRVRRWEAAAAMAVLGVDEHEVGTWPDGGLAGDDPAGVDWAGRLLDDVGPDLILTFGADGTTSHPDHIAVHHWVTQAWRERDCRPALLYATTTTAHLDRFGHLYEQWGTYMTDERPVGIEIDDLAVHLVLDGPQLDRKLTALRAMASQTSDLIVDVGPEQYAALVAEEAFRAAART